MLHVEPSTSSSDALKGPGASKAAFQSPSLYCTMSLTDLATAVLRATLGFLLEDSPASFLIQGTSCDQDCTSSEMSLYLRITTSPLTPYRSASTFASCSQWGSDDRSSPSMARMNIAHAVGGEGKFDTIPARDTSSDNDVAVWRTDGRLICLRSFTRLWGNAGFCSLSRSTRRFRSEDRCQLGSVDASFISRSSTSRVNALATATGDSSSKNAISFMVSPFRPSRRAMARAAPATSRALRPQRTCPLSNA